MTGKQRARYRAQANTLVAIVRVGKSGVTPALIQQTDEALEARELIKVKVLLDASPAAPTETAKMLGQATHAEVIQVIGGTIVLFRAKPEKQEKAAKKPAASKKPAARRAGPPAREKTTGFKKSVGEKIGPEPKKTAFAGRKTPVSAAGPRPARKTGTPRLSRGGRHQ